MLFFFREKVPKLGGLDQHHILGSYPKDHRIEITMLGIGMFDVDE